MYNNTKKTIPTFKTETFVGRVVEHDGVFGVVVQAETYLRHFLKTYATVGMEVGMKLELRKPKRTVAQNNFYFLYLGLIAESSGHTVDQLHIWAKGKFLTKGITEVFGYKVRQTNSTTDLNRSEFVEYLMRIEEETEIPIPDPEPFGIGLTMSEYEKMKEEQKRQYKKLSAKIKE